MCRFFTGKVWAPLAVLSRARICADFWAMEIIRIPDMLNVMHQWDGDGNAVPFGPIIFALCDKKRGKGGEKITLESAVLVGGGGSKATKYNPDHFGNYTRNIRATDGSRIIKLRIHLVTRFNGFKISL